MNTPYTTKSGLQIGCNYHPQATWTPTRTEAMLQDALLAKKPSIDWDGIGIIAGSVALGLVGWIVGGLLT